MALGLLLQVSCICFILFDGFAAVPVMRASGYKRVSDVQNLGDVTDDEALFTSNFHEGVWKPSNEVPANTADTRYYKPQAPKKLAPVRYQPLAQNAPVLERHVGVSTAWGLDPDRRPLSHLPSTPVKPQLGPVQPQFLAYQASAPQFPNFGTWQFPPVGSSFGVAGHGPHWVFQYPSWNTGYSPINQGGPSLANFPSYQAQALYPAGTGGQTSGASFNFGVANDKPRAAQLTFRPQKMALKIQPQRFPRPPPPPPPGSSYIIQSRNGYQRAHYHLSNSQYVPEFPAPMPVMVTAVTDPAPSDPVKTPLKEPSGNQHGRKGNMNPR